MIAFRWWLMPPVRFLEAALTLLVALVGLAVLVTSTQAAREQIAIRRLNDRYLQLTGVEPGATAALAAQRDEMVKRMSAHRLVAPPRAQLTGVLGDVAFFSDGRTMKAGQSLGDMKVLTIGPNWIEAEFNGQTQKLWVFSPPTLSAGPPAMPSARPSATTSTQR